MSTLIAPEGDYLVGFDVRSVAEDQRTSWDSARRALYLLRADVSRPLSVDPTVWPSALPEVEQGGFRGVLDHWSELDVMLDTTRAIGLVDPLRYCAVATSVTIGSMPREQERYWSQGRLEATQPSKLGPEWTVLGYDVADPWLTSGLSNCGYRVEERVEWRARWSSHLNSVHLFEQAATAASFAIASNDRVPKHAPFSVYTLRMRQLVK